MKRLVALLLSLVASLSFAQVKAAPPAEAATSSYWSIIQWDITGLGNGNNLNAERNYRAMVNQIRTLSGSTIGTNLMRTTQETERYIEIRVVDFNDTANNHRVSLYLRLDNLYLDGFTIVGHNYMFSDAPAYLTTRFGNYYPNSNALFQRMPYSSQYGSLANADTRGRQEFDGPHFGDVIRTLQGFNQNNWYGARTALAAIIGATAEAARFGWIENRIANSIGSGGEFDGTATYDYIGGFGTDLQTNWDDLSEIVYRQQNGSGNIPSVNINNRVYRSISDIVNGAGPSTPRIGPFLTHGSAR
ncbi:ribosome-inactivating family protein [Streptomyces sp. FH025]|uniref:ribosome-inactivating family protein n=1 Tax=Streptomyces sp. FH025 TaxID=2815937 RepID=UPI001A9DDA7B|nr:ribosome-inactivating family protein [Streptomyces sp. FH025]MBO1417485.1 hypothetical protein [Streptomyces sp. FH025]